MLAVEVLMALGSFPDRYGQFSCNLLTIATYGLAFSSVHNSNKKSLDSDMRCG